MLSMVSLKFICLLHIVAIITALGDFVLQIFGYRAVSYAFHMLSYVFQKQQHRRLFFSLRLRCEPT